MAFVKPIGPVGVSPALDEDRMPVVMVVNGDTWTVDADLWSPSTMEPATVENTKVEFMLSENRFSCDPFWTGVWFDGVVPDDVVPGLVHIRVPKEVSSQLRRGSYQFSAVVTDLLDGVSATELKGYFLVEYEPTSATHDIPYRHMECEGKEHDERE